MLNLIFKEYRRNLIQNTLGIIFFIIGSFILNRNEGRLFKFHSSLNEAYNDAITIKFDNAGYYRERSRDYEDKLVHFTGEIQVHEALGETSYNILVQAVKLRKIVEIYQWQEEYTENKFELTDESFSRNYYYYQEWSEKLIDSRNFHSLSHQNPRQKSVQSKITIAEKVYIGGFEISDEAKYMFNTWIEITSDTKPEDYFIKMHGNAYYHTEDLFNLQTGDMRIRFQFAGLEGDVYTIVGRFQKGKINPFINKRGRKILLLSKGTLSKEEIFHLEHSAITKDIWFTRFFSFILIMFAVSTTESFSRVLYARTRFTFLIVNSQNQFYSFVKISLIYCIIIYILRHSLHYAGILEQ
ncbi:unnamed protein product [Chironomus riparius]|uniref:Uncharacterized protein n=1 Tax=Chironomus riparius TaxID=315576 RepID=A0A9N9RPC8_9DIPT|nr:unnamed protein product [Chironomus riparius]